MWKWILWLIKEGHGTEHFPNYYQAVSIYISQNSVSQNVVKEYLPDIPDIRISEYPDRVPHKQAVAAPDPGLPEAHHHAFPIQEQGFVTHFSVLCVFILTERKEPMESIGHFPRWSTFIDRS